MDITKPFELSRGIILFSSGVGILLEKVRWNPEEKKLSAERTIAPEVLLRNFLHAEGRGHRFVLTDEDHNRIMTFSVVRMWQHVCKVLARDMMMTDEIHLWLEPEKEACGTGEHSRSSSLCAV